ncbi:SDR family oxidoreductase, partial [Streptomyces sp. NPDC057623]|uniref:SDR family oxidoreductase n=1 Tax=Streptomyces sp. NPDC057623 TaxID=3346187 RepID=UPI0036900A5B
MSIAGKSALITGAGEGIGWSIARALVAAGARVVITARREGPLKEAADRLGPAASWVAGDIADEATVQAAVAHTVAHHGGLDLVVCNAGILIPGTLTGQDMADVDRVIGVNLRGTIALMRAAAPAMAGRDSAS